MHKIAIIGTAGRDKTKPMSLALWHWMINAAKEVIPAGEHLISGGAAWADHVAVQLYLEGYAKELTLHFPAPLASRGFEGPSNSSASAANYYHDRFSYMIGQTSIRDLHNAISKGARSTCIESRIGYSGMFERNKRVAKDAEGMLAFTFGQGNVPADGGTKDTWDQCKGARLHLSLPILEQPFPAAGPDVGDGGY